jgi:hypothetical protein
MGKRKQTKKLITDIMNEDAKDGLYKQQTAVEWLWRWFNDNQEATIEEGNNAFNQAKEMEKQQNDKPIDEKLFNLANEFAVLGYGEIAVKLHSIHNGFLDNKNKTYGNNK